MKWKRERKKEVEKKYALCRWKYLHFFSFETDLLCQFLIKFWHSSVCDCGRWQRHASWQWSDWSGSRINNLRRRKAYCQTLTALWTRPHQRPLPMWARWGRIFWMNRFPCSSAIGPCSLWGTLDPGRLCWLWLKVGSGFWQVEGCCWTCMINQGWRLIVVCVAGLKCTKITL